MQVIDTEWLDQNERFKVSRFQGFKDLPTRFTLKP